MRLPSIHRPVVATALLVTGLAACAQEPPTNDPENEAVPSEHSEAAMEANGRNPGSATAEPGRSAMVRTGTALTFRMHETVSTSTHEEGDPFTAVLAADVVGDDGTVLLKAGTVGRGTVERARKSSGGDDPAELALRLEKILVEGRATALVGRVVSSEIESDTRDTAGETAAKIAVGAAAGALLGRVIGKSTEGALIGTGAGAAAGTAVAMTTKGGDAKIEEGARITIVLDEPIEIAQ